MRNNPAKRTKHKHSRGLSVNQLITTGITLLLTIVFFILTIGNCVSGNNIVYGTITQVEKVYDDGDITYNVLVEYEIDNNKYTNKVHSDEYHFEGENVVVNYDKNPKKIFINDERNSLNIKIGIFGISTGFFALLTLINIINIILFLFKFAIIRIFFHN